MLGGVSVVVNAWLVIDFFGLHIEELAESHRVSSLVAGRATSVAGISQALSVRIFSRQ